MFGRSVEFRNNGAQIGRATALSRKATGQATNVAAGKRLGILRVAARFDKFTAFNGNANAKRRSRATPEPGAIKSIHGIHGRNYTAGARGNPHTAGQAEQKE